MNWRDDTNCNSSRSYAIKSVFEWYRESDMVSVKKVVVVREEGDIERWKLL